MEDLDGKKNLTTSETWFKGPFRETIIYVTYHSYILVFDDISIGIS